MAQPANAKKQTGFISPAVYEKWDLSCPKCGSVNNVRVVGVYEAKRNPENWFCRCGTCEKSFMPRRKKEAENMDITNAAVQAETQTQQDPVNTPNDTFQAYPVGDAGGGKQKTRLEIAREKLTKERYLELIQSMPDAKITRQEGIASDVLVALKREWGLIPPKQPRNAKSSEEPEQTHIPLVKNNAQNGETCSNFGENTFGNMITPETVRQPLKNDSSVSDELCSLRITVSELSGRLDTAIRLLNDLSDCYEDLEERYGRHRHQVGPGHWSGKEEI